MSSSFKAVIFPTISTHPWSLYNHRISSLKSFQPSQLILEVFLAISNHPKSFQPCSELIPANLCRFKNLSLKFLNTSLKYAIKQCTPFCKVIFKILTHLKFKPSFTFLHSPKFHLELSSHLWAPWGRTSMGMPCQGIRARSFPSACRRAMPHAYRFLSHLNSSPYRLSRIWTLPAHPSTIQFTRYHHHKVLHCCARLTNNGTHTWISYVVADINKKPFASEVKFYSDCSQSEIEFLGIKLIKDSSLLLHAIHSPF